MPEFLDAAKDWIWRHHRVLASGIVGLLAGSGAAYMVAEVLGRLDRGGREPVGRQIAGVAALVIVTLASVTIASMPFANTGGTSLERPSPADPGASVLAQIVTALHPADYAYVCAILILAVGASLWADRRRRHPRKPGDPGTSRLLIGAGALLLGTLWIFQRGVEQLQPETRSAPQFFGTIAGAGVLAMAIIQGLRAVLPLRGVFHRVTLERWIDDAAPEVFPNVQRRQRILDSITQLARGPVSGDKYALLDLPIEQLCGQIAAGADRLLDAPVGATLETRRSRHGPATVKEVLTALAAGGDKDVDAYLMRAGKVMPETGAAHGSDDRERQGSADVPDASASGAAHLTPIAASASTQDAQEYVRLRTIISQRIQRNIDGLQISTTFWWRRVVRSLAFTVSGILGLSVFDGRITYTVMCAIVGGFVATASRDLIAVVEKARR